ncbi:HK97 family phage prohead protease [Sphingomonas sp.]|uniref:HK97 family phage prohead protease n=1 Tax=Sphingomonas sp. TaxID=28214 RepID=UPI001D421EAF|nr:HK97 family phage prohead protease [Sphingomonas sp.]MBX9796008.1 HK97 family phage prohead protease [Sphingomonas sp.]
MSLRFAGYAALFDRPDRGGDIIRAGAIGALPAEVPLLWEHRGDAVGRIERLAVDARGLAVIGRIAAPALAHAVRAGAVDGLSIGYRVAGSRRGTYRELTAISLIEVSLVRAPMQPLARVHAIEEEENDQPQ